jgi:hypothetical protein
VFGTDGTLDGATDERLAEQVAHEAAAEVAALAPGRVAVIAPAELLPALASALVDVGFPTVDPQNMRKGGLSEPLVLLAADAVNGLEFDAVVVVEPRVIAGETARGLRTLYVALTRPTQSLTVVHRAPLAAMLTTAN